MIPLVLFGVAAALGLWAASEGVHDGRTAAAVVAIVLAVAAWLRAEREHSRIVLEEIEEETDVAG